MGHQARLKAARRLVPRARRQLADATGIDIRVARVQRALRSPFFEPTWRAEMNRVKRFNPVKDLDQVRDLALQVLARDFGCDTAGVSLTFAWDPAQKTLQVFCRPAAEVVAPVAAAIRKTDLLRRGVVSRRRSWRSIA